MCLLPGSRWESLAPRHRQEAILLTEWQRSSREGEKAEVARLWVVGSVLLVGFLVSWMTGKVRDRDSAPSQAGKLAGEKRVRKGVWTVNCLLIRASYIWFRVQTQVLTVFKRIKQLDLSSKHTHARTSHPHTGTHAGACTKTDTTLSVDY